MVYLLLVSAAARQLSAAGTTGTKQQYGGCNPQEVKVYGGCRPHEVNVLGNHSQAVKVLTVFNKHYTSKTLHFSDLSYKIFSFCEQILKIGANDASGKMLQSAL